MLGGASGGDRGRPPASEGRSVFPDRFVLNARSSLGSAGVGPGTTSGGAASVDRRFFASLEVCFDLFGSLSTHFGVSFCFLVSSPVF